MKHGIYIGLIISYIISYSNKICAKSLKESYRARMPGGNLGFSVGIFTSLAVVCILCLVLRRRLYGGELGGPQRPKMLTAGARKEMDVDMQV